MQIANSLEMLAAPPARAPRPAWPLAPMLAGARARGFADGLEWLGLAAALIDERSEILHINAGAIELLGDEVFIEGGRLHAGDPELDASIADAILETLMTGTTTEVVTHGRTGRLRIAAIDPIGDDPGQLMRAVVIFEPAGQAGAGDMRRSRPAS